MGNALDELTGPTNPAGQDIRVIHKQLPVTTGAESAIFEIALWVVVPIVAGVLLALRAVDTTYGAIAIVAGVLPGVIFQIMKINGLAYLRQLEQRIQGAASNIDNYIEQRVIILRNVVGLVEKSIKVDQAVIDSITSARAGSSAERYAKLDVAMSGINVIFEAYPDLKSQDVIMDAMRQNSYLQKEITAARTLYNETVGLWNREIFAWPTLQIVAAKQGYSTRIPFSVPDSIREEARGVFFK